MANPKETIKRVIGGEYRALHVLKGNGTAEEAIQAFNHIRNVVLDEYEREVGHPLSELDKRALSGIVDNEVAKYV